DISTLNGGEAQLIFETDAENLGVVGFAGFGSREVTTDIANIGGIPASAERAYFGVGAHYTHHFSEQFRGFFQGGIMHQSGKFSLAGVSQSETALGLFVAAGFEAMMSDSVSLVLTARPLEPSLDFDGVDVDSTTFTVGVGLKL
ncbi:MAG: outer membrane beta-barrel protein, partial [Phycisphaerales bacterium]|nr:outer membrane beta-barrel protein [Phycisphaerales bacterium]